MQKQDQRTERGGSVVTHETLIREVPGSNPGADQPDWGFFVVFLSHQGKCRAGFSLPRSIWSLKYPQLVSNTRSGWGMRCDEAPIYRSVSSKGAGRPRLTHHHNGGWNETKWMKWEWRNGGMKFVVGENGRNPVKNLPRPRFVHHETHMEGPKRELETPAVGGERLTACATRPPPFN